MDYDSILPPPKLSPAEARQKYISQIEGFCKNGGYVTTHKAKYIRETINYLNGMVSKALPPIA